LICSSGASEIVRIDLSPVNARKTAASTPEDEIDPCFPGPPHPQAVAPPWTPQTYGRRARLRHYRETDPTPRDICQTAPSCIHDPDKAANSSPQSAPPRHHVPHIERDSMRRQHINVVGRVNHFVLPINKVDWLNMVSPRPLHRRALDLHPPQPPARIQDKVIALTIAPGLVTLNPSPTALCRNAASASSPVRLVLRDFFGSNARSLGDGVEDCAVIVPLSRNQSVITQSKSEVKKIALF
jgi:hypothetical protein